MSLDPPRHITEKEPSHEHMLPNPRRSHGLPTPNRVRIFDTTLRDGEQSPGASMNMAEKLEVARALAALGVDIIEAGFPIASPGDFEAVRAIATEVTGATVCGLARCNDRDIDRAWEALKYAQKPRIHVFLATSAIHREHKLQDDPRRRSSSGPWPSVRRAKGYCADVEFSPEDAARTEIDFLCEVVEAAIEAGATTVNIPDTVGYATPTQYAGVIRTLARARAATSTGRSSASTATTTWAWPSPTAWPACEAGARQVECTINGIGERAGNAALEEIVMALKTRSDYYGLTTGIKTERLYPGQPDGLDDHRPGRPAEQGDRRPQRLRPRVGHPPGRHAQGALDLRDHAARGGRRPQDRPGPGQALRPPRPARPGDRAGLSPERRAARDPVRRLQGAGRQEEGSLRRGPGRPDREAHPGRARALVSWSACTRRPARACCRRPRSAIRRPDGEIVQDAAIGDGPVDAIFKAVERVTGRRTPTSASSPSGA